MAQLGGHESTNSVESLNAANELHHKYKTAEEDDNELLEEAWDDATGARSNPEGVKRARNEEVEYVHKADLHTKVPITERDKKTGKAPISVRWVDINMGDGERPKYRSRFFAREINIRKREG